MEHHVFLALIETIKIIVLFDLWMSWKGFDTFDLVVIYKRCRNPSIRLATKARACKGESQKGSPGITSHAPRSVGECEGMNPHTPKWTPILGVKVLMDFQIFKTRFQGSKPIGLRSYLYHPKVLGT